MSRYPASVADLGFAIAQLSLPVSPSNFLEDVNAFGTLTVPDEGLTNSNLTKALPSPRSCTRWFITAIRIEVTLAGIEVGPTQRHSGIVRVPGGISL